MRGVEVGKSVFVFILSRDCCLRLLCEFLRCMIGRWFIFRGLCIGWLKCCVRLVCWILSLVWLCIVI